MQVDAHFHVVQDKMFRFGFKKARQFAEDLAG